MGSVKRDLSHLPTAQRVLRNCDELAAITALEGGILRAYLTPEHARANARVASWMTAAGMTSWQDAAGNICGRYAAASADAPVLLLGSHLDTVPNAGKYDGTLGVLSAIEVIRSLSVLGVSLPFHVDVIGFADEEGVRFGATLLGSKAVAGLWDESLWERTDSAGISLREAMVSFGLDPAAIATASRAGANLLGYWELHIEQGPVLEDQFSPLGVVTSIAGARRFQLTIDGMAGHAGTVPMHLRRDAMVTAARIILEVERIARQFNVVATVGQISANPGAVNVIAGQVQLSLDIRSSEDRLRDTALAELQYNVRRMCMTTPVSWSETHSSPAVSCDLDFQHLFCAILDEHGHKPVSLSSGAGHDAMAMAAIGPVAMLFMRCEKGISHHPAEAVSAGDTQLALIVLRDALLQLAADINAPDADDSDADDSFGSDAGSGTDPDS
jgi:allantoate deiminase